jgi:hypothetical protein
MSLGQANSIVYSAMIQRFCDIRCELWEMRQRGGEIRSGSENRFQIFTIAAAGNVLGPAF